MLTRLFVSLRIVFICRDSTSRKSIHFSQITNLERVSEMSWEPRLIMSFSSAFFNVDSIFRILEWLPDIVLAFQDEKKGKGTGIYQLNQSLCIRKIIVIPEMPSCRDNLLLICVSWGYLEPCLEPR